MRPVAIRKLAPVVPIVAGAVEAGAATGAATTAATAGTGIGSALMQGAKKKIGQVGVKDAAQIAQDATDKHAERAQQAQQNNIQSSQNMADKAKEEAKVTKAWRFAGGKINGLNAPQYAKFTNNLIENAKRVAVKPDFHYSERMGEVGDPNEHRYQGRQPFIHNGKEINVTPHQIASAFMDHLHTDKSFTDKNHHEDTVHSLENMFETDTPHHDPYWEERGGNNMRRNEHGNVLINTLTPQMIGNTTTGYKSKTATPFQTIFSKYTNRINPLDFATQNEVHDLPQVPNRPKGPSAQVRVRNAVANSKHGVANLSPQQFADRKIADMFGNRNPIGPYGTKVPRPTGDGDDIFDQRLGWLSTWYHGTKQKDEPQDEPQQETGSTHRLSPDYNPNLVKPQQPEPEPEPEGEPDYQPSPIPGMVYLNGKLIADPRNIGTGEPMDIAMRLLKGAYPLSSPSMVGHTEEYEKYFNENILPKAEDEEHAKRLKLAFNHMQNFYLPESFRDNPGSTYKDRFTGEDKERSGRYRNLGRAGYKYWSDANKKGQSLSTGRGEVHPREYLEEDDLAEQEETRELLSNSKDAPYETTRYAPTWKQGEFLAKPMNRHIENEKPLTPKMQSNLMDASVRGQLSAHNQLADLEYVRQFMDLPLVQSVTPKSPLQSELVYGELNDNPLFNAGEPMDIAMRLLKGSVHLTHNEDLPHQFAQDIANLDHNHQIMPTETGSSINHIHPDMLRTIELMAQNYQENSEEEQEEPFVMPKLFV